MLLPVGFQAAPAGWHLMFALGTVMASVYAYIHWRCCPGCVPLRRVDLTGSQRVLNCHPPAGGAGPRPRCDRRSCGGVARSGAAAECPDTALKRPSHAVRILCARPPLTRSTELQDWLAELMRRRAEVLESFRQGGHARGQAYLLPRRPGFVRRAHHRRRRQRARGQRRLRDLVAAHRHRSTTRCSRSALRNACNCAPATAARRRATEARRAAIMVRSVSSGWAPRVAQEGPPARHRAAPPRAAYRPVRAAGWYDLCTSQPRAQRGDDETRPAGHHAGRVGGFRPEVPRRDGDTGQTTPSRAAGRALAPDQLLGRLLL